MNKPSLVATPAPVLTLVKSQQEPQLPTTLPGQNFQIFTDQDGRKYAADVTQRDAHTAFLIWIPLPRAVDSQESDFISVFTDLDLLFQVLEQHTLNRVEVELFKNKVRRDLKKKKCFMTGLKG